MLLFEVLSPTLSHCQFYSFSFFLEAQGSENNFDLAKQMMVFYFFTVRWRSNGTPIFQVCIFICFPTIFCLYLLFVCFSQISHSGKCNPHICPFSGLIVEKKVVAIREDAYDGVFDNTAVFSLPHTLPLTCFLLAYGLVHFYPYF